MKQTSYIHPGNKPVELVDLHATQELDFELIDDGEVDGLSSLQYRQIREPMEFS